MSDKIINLDHVLTMSAMNFNTVIVSSFGPTSMVMLDRIAKLKLDIPVLTIDTGELFSETHDLRKQIEAKYGFNIQIIKASNPTPKLWQTDTDKCCNERKVMPLKLALQGREAWLTGLRRDQASTRKDQLLMDWDTTNKLIKIAPMVEWSRDEVWAYLEAYNVPYNRLHDQGYKSVGCTHCTRPSAGTDERSGRWVGQVKTECGLHLASSIA